MAAMYEVVMDGGGPWGIRLQGGKDFGVQLNVARVCNFIDLVNSWYWYTVDTLEPG